MTRAGSGHSEHNIEAVRVNMGESPGISIRHCALDLEISTATLHRILNKDLYLHTSKDQFAQQRPIC